MENKYEFEIEGGPMMMHKFNGLSEEKDLKEQSDSTRAEAYAYRLENGNLAMPGEWIKGCIRNFLIENAPNKKKMETRNIVSPRLRVEPMFLDLKIKEYEIDKRSVPSGNLSRGGVRDFVVRPLIRKWKVKGILISTLDKTDKEMHEIIKNAGIDTGVGANRPNGYGRFKLLSFKKMES